jgi:hypothetical protein
LVLVCVCGGGGPRNNHPRKVQQSARGLSNHGAGVWGGGEAGSGLAAVMVARLAAVACPRSSPPTGALVLGSGSPGV